MHPPTTAKSHTAASPSPGKAKPAHPPTPAHDNPIWFRLATRAPAQLAVAPPDDPTERQAEQVAEQVVAAPAGSAGGAGAAPPPDDPAPPGSSSGGPAADGQPLSPEDLGFFQPQFGHDFSGVRLHTDAGAHSAAVALRARAFTLGRDIAFRAGQYDPESPAGRELLAHELAHVALHSGPAGAGPAVIRRSAEGPSAIPLLVEDTATDLAPGQMRRTDFLAALARAVCAAVEPVIAARGRTTKDCPYVEVVFRYLDRQPLDQIERSVRNVAPGLGPDTPADEYVALIADRARKCAEDWAVTGKITGLPEGLIPPALAGSVTPEADAEAQSQAEGGTESPVRFQAKPGGSRAASPAAVRAELGPGSPVEGGVRSRMESVFGTGLGDIRTHTDPAAARVADRLNARALAVGEHVAFGPGEYRPGTLSGDALIAHEFAHVIQQRGTGSADRDESASAGLEEDADAAAADALVGLWGEEEQRLALPRRRSGLRLQRCKVPGPELTALPDDTEELSRLGYELIIPPGEVPVGRTYHLQLSSRTGTDTSRGLNRVEGSRWYAIPPGEQALVDIRKYQLGSGSWTLDAPGEWQFVVRLRFGPKKDLWLRHSVQVRPIEEAAEENLRKVQATDLTGFFVRLELQYLQNVNLATADQKYGPSYISLSGNNPARTHRSNVYTVHPPPGVTPARYEWLAVPMIWTDYQRNIQAPQHRVVQGRKGFGMGRGTTASLPIGQNVGAFDIWCTMYDAQDSVVAEARYRQVTLPDAEYQAVKKFQDYMSDARKELRKLRQESAVYLPAVHVEAETGTVKEITLFIGPPAKGSGLTIIDATPDVKVREYEGDDFAEVLEDFGKQNLYPPGQIRLKVPTNTLGVPSQEWNVKTTGTTVAKRLSSGWGWASLGFAALGVLASIIPGAQPAAPAFFLASAGLGALSAGASLYQQSQEAHPSEGTVAIDIAALAGSLLGFAGAANVLRHGPRIAAATKTGQFVLYAGFTTDVVGGVFIAVTGADQIASILEGSGSAEEKGSAVARILAGLMLNGTLLGWGAKSLKATNKNLRAVLGEAIETPLSNAERHALSLIEGPALNRLAQVPDGQRLQEVRRVAALIREDPVRAGRLINLYGAEQFVTGIQGRPANLGELAESLSVSRRAALVGYAAANLHTMVDAAAATGLSKQLGMEVRIDSSLAGRDIFVEYTLGSWVTGTRIGVRVGPQASVGDIIAHAVVLDHIHDYRVLTNDFRDFTSRAKAWLGGQRMTRAAELAAEIDKHGLLVEARLAAKSGKDVSTIHLDALQRDIDELQGRMVAFHGELTQLGAPEGIIAAGWRESFSQQQLEALLDALGSGFQRYRHPGSGNRISEPGFRHGAPLDMSRAQLKVPALRGRGAGASFPDVFGAEAGVGQNVMMELKTVYRDETVRSFFNLPDVRDNILREVGGWHQNLPPGTIRHLVVDIRQAIRKGIPDALADLTAALGSYRNLGDARPLFDGVRFITGTPRAPVLSGVYQIP